MTLDLPDDKASAGDVASSIEEATAIPKGEQGWKSGFPPRPLEKLYSSDPLPSDIDMLHVAKATSVNDATVDFTSTAADNADDASSAMAADAGSTLHAASLSIPDDSAIEEPPLTDPEGYVVRRVIDADNSCLFNSIGLCMERSRSKAHKLRQMVADAVLSDPFTYNEAFLGKPTDEYATWILNPASWGGQIELSIFSRVLRVEIAAFDVIRDRFDVYGTEDKYKRRIMVIYDGIHYDALAFCFDPSLPEEMDVVQFSPKDSVVMERAKALCAEQHRARQFTDTSNFTLRCLVCQEGLVGQKGAQEHAEKTGHTNFAEF